MSVRFDGSILKTVVAAAEAGTKATGIGQSTKKTSKGKKQISKEVRRG